MKSLLVLDTLDDRREIHYLLGKLPPMKRVKFLEWCISKLPPDAKGHAPNPYFDAKLLDQAGRCDRADLRVTNEVYSDLWMLVGQWQLDPEVMAEGLESWVSRVEYV